MERRQFLGAAVAGGLVAAGLVSGMSSRETLLDQIILQPHITGECSGTKGFESGLSVYGTALNGQQTERVDVTGKEFESLLARWGEHWNIDPKHLRSSFSKDSVTVKGQSNATS